MFSRKSRNGTARIVRDSYSNIKSSWWVLRKKVVDRDGGKCKGKVGGVFCNKPAREVHHIIPLARGGVSEMSNLISLCKSCHEARHSHMRKK